MAYINVRYLAKVATKDDLKSLPFEEAWAKCGGKYPFRVMAIDATRNRNDWGINADRLGAFASKMNGIQLRMDHGDTALSTIGRVPSAVHNTASGEVYADAWTDEQAIARRLHNGVLDSVSMQARAKNVECGACAMEFGKCKCKDTWKSLVDPEPVEMSVVAEGAYDGARVISGFRAAMDKEVETMDKYDELKAQIEELKKTVASFKAEAPLPDTPAPTKTDNSDKKKQGHTTGDSDPTVTDTTEKAGSDQVAALKAEVENLKKELNKFMDEEKKEPQHKEGKKAAKCAEAEPEEKKAGIETSASFQSRRSQPGATETFTAKAGTNAGTHLTFKAFLAARESGKDPYDGVPEAKSPYTKTVAALQTQGYDEDSANFGADYIQAFNDIKGKTTIEHGGA